MWPLHLSLITAKQASTMSYGGSAMKSSVARSSLDLDAVSCIVTLLSMVSLVYEPMGREVLLAFDMKYKWCEYRNTNESD